MSEAIAGFLVGIVCGILIGGCLHQQELEGVIKSKELEFKDKKYSMIEIAHKDWVSK